MNSCRQDKVRVYLTEKDYYNGVFKSDVFSYHQIPDSAYGVYIENTNLTSNTLKLPHNLKVLRMTKCMLNDVLEHLPPTLIRLCLNDCNCHIIPIPGISYFRFEKDYPCSINTALPDTLEYLEIRNSSLHKISQPLPPKLRHLNLYRNLLEEFTQTLPQTLQVLDLTNNRIEVFTQRLPPNLRVLRLRQNRICEFGQELPSTLECLNLGVNFLMHFIIDIPFYMERLYLDSNRIGECVLRDKTRYGSSLKCLNISHNKLHEFDINALPDTIETLYLDNNKLTCIEMNRFFENLCQISVYNNPLKYMEISKYDGNISYHYYNYDDWYVSPPLHECDTTYITENLLTNEEKIEHKIPLDVMAFWYYYTTKKYLWGDQYMFYSKRRIEQLLPVSTEKVE